MDPVLVRKLSHMLPSVFLGLFILFVIYQLLRFKAIAAAAEKRHKVLTNEAQAKQAEFRKRESQMHGAALTVLSHDEGPAPRGGPNTGQPGAWLHFKMRIEPPPTAPQWWPGGLKIANEDQMLNVFQEGAKDAPVYGPQEVTLVVFVPKSSREIHFLYYDAPLGDLALS